MIFQGGEKFSKAKIFLIGCLVLIAGIALASFLPGKILDYGIWWFGAAIFFLTLTLLPLATRATCLPARQANAGQAKNGFWRNGGAAQLCFLVAAVFLFAVWRYGISLPANTPDKIWHYNGQTMTMRGFVANEPDIRETSQKLEIRVIGACYQSGREACPYKYATGKILVTTDLYPEYQYGDSLEMACELKPPEEFNGFAYDRYLARYDIYSVCYYPKIIFPSTPAIAKTSSNPRLGKEGDNSVLPSPSLSASWRTGAGEIKRGLGGGNIFYRKIFVFKKVMAGLIDSGLSEPESSLARPIVFGGQKGLEQAIRDDFQKVGLTHIMAVSGFNISILAAIVMVALLALGLSRGLAFYLAVILLAAYIVLVGLPASAMRAGLMGFLVLWALKLGRLNKMTNSLVLTAAILLMINPKLLRDDVGFQLSFLAIAGLAYVYPIMEAVWVKIKLPKFKGLSDALLITLAAQVFTLPVLAYNFSQISLIAPLANLAVLWAIPILTVLILAALPLSFIFPSLSFLFFFPSLILTKYILAAVKFFAGRPHSYLAVDYLPLGWVALYYIFIIFIIIKLRQSKLLSQEINPAF